VPKHTVNHRLSNRRQAILGALLVVFACAAAEIATRAGWLDNLEYTYYDLWHNLAGVRVEPKHVVIVSVDNQTLLDHQDEPLAFWGPHFARAVEVLRRAGARIIGLDYLFRASAESWLRRLDVPGSDKSRTYDIPMRAQLAAGQVVLIGTIAGSDHGQSELLLPVNDYLFVLPGGRMDVGLSNFYPDKDEMVRRFVPALLDDGTTPSLTFATLLAVRAAGLNPEKDSWSLGGQRVLNTPFPRRIGFVGPPGTIPRLSFGRLLNPGADTDPDIQRLLKDKVAIIAAEHAGSQDIHLTPYAQAFLGIGGRVMTGAELHANIVETLRTGQFPWSVPSWLRLIYLIAVLIPGTILCFSLNPWRGLGIGLLFGLVCIVLAYLFFRINWILPVTSIHLALALSYLGTLGFRLTGEERERARLRRMFGQYVSDEVVEKLLATGHRPDLGGEALQVTILFADIRNFTKLSQRLSSHQVVDMLNTYLSRVCEPILEQGGTVDKFIGDAVMAVFGSPVRFPDHARHAIGAALAMAATAREFRSWMCERFAGLDLPEFNIGIGLHTGDAVIGNIGSPKRKEFTAIGDTVNTASRIEEITKQLGSTIVASGATIIAAGPGVLTGKREKVSIRGRDEQLEVFEIIGLQPEEGEKP
jgi:adenylate cyclase